MIYLVLPTGSYHGWGVCGKYIVKEMSRMAAVRLITDSLDPQGVSDVFDFRVLCDCLVSAGEEEAIRRGTPVHVDAPVLQAINNAQWLPHIPHFNGRYNVGYTFFEDNVIHPSQLERMSRYFDTVVTGSTWCEEVLRGCGLEAVTTIIQGIDPGIFNPQRRGKEYFPDRFVIFSGGKFELRKGQDLVIRAYKVLQDRYGDVMLINSWYNAWPQSLQTMSASPHISFRPDSDDHVTLVNHVLRDNGIDLERVITLPPYPNIMMARVYGNCDIGLFPNRCEGGTNLVLMEFMACGKPVLASFNSGHRDVLTPENSLPLMRMRPLTISSNEVPIAVWDEPDLDEMVDKLDWAYHHREALGAIGEKAGLDLSLMTWKETARRFYDLMRPFEGPVSLPPEGSR